MAYIYNMADTWADAGTTFTAIKMNVTDTASNAASLLMDLQVGGTSRLSVRKDGRINGAAANTFVNSNGGFWSFYSSNIFVGQIASVNAIGGNSTGFHAQSLGLVTSEGVVPDIILARDAANILAQRNSTNAQAFRVYNTFTDASNYERLEMSWGSNIISIGPTAAGTGAVRSMQFSSGGTGRWTLNTSGHLLSNADNTYDIGASGANRPRNLFLGGLLNLGGVSLSSTGNTAILTNNGNSQTLTIGIATNTFMFGGITSAFPALQRNGNELRVRLADDSGFTAIRVSQIGFNGATSSFPMIKNNGAAAETKLADDSAYAPHAMQYLDVTDGITAPGAAAGRARIYVDTADGDLKVVFADGTVKTIVTDT